MKREKQMGNREIKWEFSKADLVRVPYKEDIFTGRIQRFKSPTQAEVQFFCEISRRFKIRSFFLSELVPANQEQEKEFKINSREHNKLLGILTCSQRYF